MEENIIAWIKSREAGRIAVLRHEVAGISRRAESDWDIAVTEVGRARETLKEALGDFDLWIDRRYVSQHFIGGEQIDLFERFEWNGSSFLESERFWSGVKPGDDGIPRPSVAHDALIALMVGLLGGGTFSDRYRPLMELALETEEKEFSSALEWAVGREAAQDLVALLKARQYDDLPTRCRSLRKALVRKRLGDDFFGSARAMVSHWVTELKHHLDPPFPWIAFLGPDGAGKSTVIEGVNEEFARRRLHARRLHWRPDFCRETGEEAKLVSDPHQVPPRGVIPSIAKLFFFWGDWVYSHNIPLRHSRAKNKVTIADRFYLDLLADPRRYRYGAPLWPASLLFRLFPKPDLTIVLSGDPAIFYHRKQEVELGEVARQVTVYEGLAGRKGVNGRVIDATRSIEAVQAEVWAEVLALLRTHRGCDGRATRNP